MLYMTEGLKRLKNHFHASKTKESLYRSKTGRENLPRCHKRNSNITFSDLEDPQEETVERHQQQQKQEELI
jgi:hypothetical protein